MPVTNNDVNVENVVQESTDYNQFVLMNNNRDQNRGHIEALKRAFEEIGNLTKVQPILVNERYEIIDGQHRFIACQELGQPVYFTMREGLGINDARLMNVLHKNWTVEDYAKSYANTDRNYREYLQLKEEFGFSHSITVLYIYGSDRAGMYKDFRAGNLVVADLQAARERLSRLASAADYTTFTHDKAFAAAYLRTMQVEGFDERRMHRKLAQVGERYLRRFSQPSDYQRAFEEIYNFQISDANRLRLY